MEYKKLLEPITINGITLKNRLIAAAIGGNSGRDGYVDQIVSDYYIARARGKWGLITFEATTPRYPGGKGCHNAISLSDNKYISGMKGIVDNVHAENVPIILQIVDMGRNTKSAVGGIPLSSSSVHSYTFLYPELPRAVTIEEIDWLVDNFIKCTERAMKAGFDGVEIHCGHGYLISSFISPYVNHRTDEYGGSTENRMKFPLRIMAGVRNVMGKSKILSVRVNATDFLNEGGLEVEEGYKVSQMLVDAGADLINVSAGLRESDNVLKDYSMVNPRGNWVFLGKGMKKMLGKNTPVAIASRINTPDIAEQILEETNIDLVEIGRGCIADAEFPKKVIEGRTDDIRTCIACPGGGGNHMWPDSRPDRTHLHITCAVNPALRHDMENKPLKQTDKVKNILIAGGGPAGMWAAIDLSKRGHKVILCEKTKALGGQVRYSSRIPGLGEFETLVNDLSYQVYKHGVDVRLGTKVTHAYVTKSKPDVLIIATGVEEKASWNISGSKETDVNMVFVNELLKEPQSYEWAKLGENVALFCAGLCCPADSWFGCEAVLALLEKGKKVTFITHFDDMFAQMPWPGVRYFRLRMEKTTVRKITNAKLVRFEKSGVVVRRKNKEETIQIDSLVAAIVKPDKKLINSLNGNTEIGEIYQIGDCVKLGCIEKAISDGFATAIKV